MDPIINPILPGYAYLVQSTQKTWSVEDRFTGKGKGHLEPTGRARPRAEGGRGGAAPGCFKWKYILIVTMLRAI